MKKILATTLAVVGLAACVNAQGTFIVDSYANGLAATATPTSTSGGLVFLNGVLDTGTDINLSILWGTSSTGVNNVLNLDPGAVNVPANTAFLASQGTGSGDITSYANGGIYDPNGNFFAVPAEASGTTIWMVLQGWTGSDTTYATALTDLAQGVYTGATGPFQLTLAASTAPTQPDLTPMGSLNLVSVPEPTSLALAGLGGFGMLMALRRKQA